MNGDISSLIHIISGVSKYAILGSVQIYINDIPGIIISQLSIYANDTVIYSCTISDPDRADKLKLKKESNQWFTRTKHGF